MAKRRITNDLLNLTVESKIEAGVDPAEIHRLVYAFVLDDARQEHTGDTVGFLGVEDILDAHREAFLEALLALAPKPAVVVPVGPSAPVRGTVRPRFTAARLRYSIGAALGLATTPLRA